MCCEYFCMFTHPQYYGFKIMFEYTWDYVKKLKDDVLTWTHWKAELTLKSWGQGKLTLAEERSYIEREMTKRKGCASLDINNSMQSKTPNIRKWILANVDDFLFDNSLQNQILTPAYLSVLRRFYRLFYSVPCDAVPKWLDQYIFPLRLLLKS